MKILSRSILYLLIATGIAFGCREEDLTGDLLKPWVAPDVSLTQDPAIGAYYSLSFNDTNWLNIDPLYIPGMGKYSSADPAVIRQHLEWSAQCGIDFWIIAHDPVSDSILLHVFPEAGGSANISIALSMNLSVLAGVQYIDLTDSASIQAVIAEFKKLAPIFGLPDYMEMDGKPLVVLQGVYDYQPRPDFLTGAVTDERVAALAGFRAMLADSTGYEFYFMGDYVRWIPPERYADYTGAFDALTSQMQTNQKSLSNFFNENVDLAYGNWKSFLDSRSVAFVPSVFPGLNDTINGGQTDVYVRSESFFSDGCQVAKKHMDKTIRMVLINSFNDWPSGTQVEPANTYGSLYLDIIRDEFKVN